MMVRLFSAVAKEVRGMHEAAYLLAGFALGSQLLALVRDRILASTFGASHTLDLYYAAFRLPDFLFATVASLLSLYALLPVLSRFERENEALVVSFLRDTLGIFFVAMALVCGAAALVMLMRILLLQPLLLGLSNTLASFTQLKHRFILYSVSPLLYNLGIIFGAVVLYPRLGLAGLGWGVVLGAFMHCAVQLPFFFGHERGAALPRRALFSHLREVLVLSVPRTLSLAAGQISLLIIVALASFLAPGSIAVFTFAYNLQAVPLTIIGVSYSVAAFPTLARLFAAGKQSEFSSHIEAALRHIIFWAVPATVFIVVLRAQLVRVILGAGQFDWAATRLTAAALALFVLSLAAQSVTLLIMRAYYAAGETKKPLYRGIVDIFVSVGSALLLLSLFHSSIFVRDFIESLLRVSDIPGTTVLMLSLGYTIGALAQCGIGFLLFLRTFSIATARLKRLLWQSFAASVIGGGISYAVLALLGATGNTEHTFEVFLQGLAAGCAGLAATAFILALMKNEELAEAWAAFSRRLRDAVPVALEPGDITSA
jgi:putative peptidoglycan lipid II flippase